MLKSSTIARELSRRGWKLMNGGPDWDSFMLARAGQADPYDVTANVNHRTHEVVLSSRSLKLPHIHFKSHGRLDKLEDLQVLEIDAARLQALITLDLATLTHDPSAPSIIDWEAL
jgi:hypothetical protein